MKNVAEMWQEKRANPENPENPENPGFKMNPEWTGMDKPLKLKGHRGGNRPFRVFRYLYKYTMVDKVVRLEKQA